MLWMVRALAGALCVFVVMVTVSAKAETRQTSDFTEINNQIRNLRIQGRYIQATPIAEKALAFSERTLGSDHPETVQAVNNLATLYQAQGRYDRAEPLFRRAVASSERALGSEHPNTLVYINNLAELYSINGRHVEAEQLFRRTLATSERVLGKDHPTTITCLDNLAKVYRYQGRYRDAELLQLRAVETSERVLGAEDRGTIACVNNLAVIYRAQGRYAEAEPLYLRALALAERVRGKEHPATLMNLSNLAGVYNAQGRYAEAEPLYQRLIAIRERVLGVEHPDTLFSFATLAEVYFKQGDWERAAQLWRRSTAGVAARTRRDVQDTGALTKKFSEAEQMSWQFSSLVRAVYHLAEDGRTSSPGALREMFETAQWALSSQAADSMAQMAARSAKGDGVLAQLVRERQDLLAEWQQRDLTRNISLSLEPGERDIETDKANAARIAAIEERIAGIDKRLALDFPDYAELANPAPLSVGDVQSHLGVDEALVLIIFAREWKPTPEETFVWIITKTEAQWRRADMGNATLAREVQALRCGLDTAAWSGPHCRELLGIEYTDDDADKGKPLPFDLARSHALYKALFSPFEDLIKDKHLLIVPSGPLTQLPFQVLVSTPPTNGDFRSVAWLVRDHALTILPAVSSLKALRRVVHRSSATKAMIGFGNPLLDGPDRRYAKLAQLSRNNQQCKEANLEQVASLLRLRGVKPVETRGGLVNVSNIRMQVPLPETANELCAVARDLKADASELRLGALATEREVKALSSSGQLSRYRIVHFATHGALAGELNGTREPGLLLTPPAEATADDDGYLSASEIANLKLDADWVILSACNTAAGDTSGAEALSGLARGFIYAQARALLVSHWAVNSNATVKLITKAMGELSRDPSVGRAEALRRSMRALMETGDERETHPAFWAPFIVVGEGTR